MSGDDNDALGAAILTDDLSDVLRRAEAGDVLAARDALPHLAFLLSTSNTHPTTGDPLPVPEYVRNYLANSFAKIAKQVSDGAAINANKALHLTKPGPKKWGHFEKRLAADLVFQLVAKSFPIADSTDGKDATTIAAGLILKNTKPDDCPSSWLAFKDKEIDPATLKTWYFEHKSELEELRKKIEL